MARSGRFPVARILARPTSSATVWAGKKIAAAKRVPLAATRSFRMVMVAIADHIEAVIAARPPHQVGQMVIGRVVVSMPTLQAFGARTNKRLQDKAVNVPPAAGRVKDDGKVTVLVGDRLEDASPKLHRPMSPVGHRAVNGTNLARITDLVITKAHNGFPHVTHSMARVGH